MPDGPSAPAEARCSGAQQRPSVFLSHAGEQKASLVSCLYELLTKAAGINTFLDEHSLRYGQSNAAQMERALKDAPLGMQVLCKQCCTKTFGFAHRGAWCGLRVAHPLA
jgi:hypothetical protein